LSPEEEQLSKLLAIGYSMAEKIKSLSKEDKATFSDYAAKKDIQLLSKFFQKFNIISEESRQERAQIVQNLSAEYRNLSQAASLN